MLLSTFLQFHDSGDALTVLKLLQCINPPVLTWPSPCFSLKFSCHEAPPVQKSQEEYHQLDEGTIPQGQIDFQDFTALPVFEHRTLFHSVNLQCASLSETVSAFKYFTSHLVRHKFCYAPAQICVCRQACLLLKNPVHWVHCIKSLNQNLHYLQVNINQSLAV